MVRTRVHVEVHMPDCFWERGLGEEALYNKRIRSRLEPECTTTLLWTHDEQDGVPQTVADSVALEIMARVHME